ncbi:MAG: DEAD/DEAH box helicase [Bacteroidetes bacterium]|nr:DEAD/DEAH box helicase [Bacteroidota bacterium]
MAVDSSKKFLLVYSLNPESEIGAVIDPYVVQLNEDDSLSLTFQKIYHNTMEEYASGIDDNDREAIRLSTEYSADAITKKFSKKEMRPQEFLQKHLDDKTYKLTVRPYIEDRINAIMGLIADKNVYLRVKTNPAQEKLEVITDEVSTHFHFKREEDGTKYYPTFRLNGEKIVLINKKVMMLTNKPCRLVMDDNLYVFDKNMDGMKLTPFFTKWNIHIPKTSEAEYYKRFIAAVIENNPSVKAEGFTINAVTVSPKPVLKVVAAWNHESVLSLYFDYGKEEILCTDTKPTHVVLEATEDSYTYHRINRDFAMEKAITDSLVTHGLQQLEGAIFRPLNGISKYSPQQIIAWVNEHNDALASIGVTVTSDDKIQKYYMGKIHLNVEIAEKTDWFDIYATAQFGEFKIPFIRLKKYITQGIREFELPNGITAIIPEEWFGKYREILTLSLDDDQEHISLKKHHFALIDEVFTSKDSSIASISEYEKATRNLRDEEDFECPTNFVKILRPYQKEGFEWMKFLQKNNFGGCLADDMGLGKTIQTLTLLQSEKNNQKVTKEKAPVPTVAQLNLFGNNETALEQIQKKRPSLIVMPTSLIHNWEYEIKKFAPELKTVSYTGLAREEMRKYFGSADIILTTYGTARNDIDIFNNYEFNYLILDESQVIKNPTSKISRLVKTLKARHRLSLTGTPIENSLLDLWSQLSFLNPGMLGSYQFFKDEFAIPIEKKNSEEHKKKLQSLINPFILRRTKEEVAKDLPELSEKIYFCEMTEQQREVYEETRNYYRNRILENIEKFGEKKSQFFILKGLMQLRLIANHPSMNKTEYEGDSGKFTDMMATLEEIISGNHKILVFSSFVRHLDLMKAHLTKSETPFTYLTGETRNRKSEIDKFKKDDDIKVFLMSLKAGGVGLNLTEADYIFIADPWWNPAAELQAINRAHRIGQEKNVFAYKFISKETVEEKILLMQDRKLRLSAEFIHTSAKQEGIISTEDVNLLFG